MDIAEHAAAVAAAQNVFKLIRKDYAELGPYLVLSLPGAQISVESNPRQIVAECPSMVIDDAEKREVSRLLEAGSDQAALTERMNHLQFAGNVQIELRFNTLRYALIWKLQADERVDRQRTSQGKASINIVLGTLESFNKRLPIEEQYEKS